MKENGTSWQEQIKYFQKISEQLQKEGYLFWREGSGWSVSEGIINSIQAWLKISKGQSLTVKEWTEFSKKTKKVSYCMVVKEK